MEVLVIRQTWLMTKKERIKGDSVLRPGRRRMAIQPEWAWLPEFSGRKFSGTQAWRVVTQPISGLFIIPT